jgi:hypothetical protein
MSLGEVIFTSQLHQNYGWGIIRQSNLYWYERTIHDIMYACIILDNMIIEDEKDNNLFVIGILNYISTCEQKVKQIRNL